MSAASDRLRELVYPTKINIYIGLGSPPEPIVSGDDIKALIDEREELLTTLEGVAKWSHGGHGCFPASQCGLCKPVLEALAKARAR